jgi:hypothetical protein
MSMPATGGLSSEPGMESLGVGAGTGGVPSTIGDSGSFIAPPMGAATPGAPAFDPSSLQLAMPSPRLSATNGTRSNVLDAYRRLLMAMILTRWSL